MKVCVMFPWRPTPDRIRAFQEVRDWYTNHFPDWWIGTGASSHDPFSRAGSRNTCVRMAVDEGADIVIINDADTIPDMNAVLTAVHGASERGGLHFGLDTMRYLSEEETQAYYNGEVIDRSGLTHDSSVIVMRPLDYIRAGGQDERFTGYGGEDNAFAAAALTLLRNVEWHHGPAISLYHDPSVRDIGSERWVPNMELNIRYQTARSTPKAMRRLINERTYPGAIHVEP